MPDNDSNDKTRTHIQLQKDIIIGHYRIIERIGAGGMGEVYLAEDTKLHRKVALKFLPLHLCQDPECRARFKREAQAAAKLNHPNIVTIYEVSEFNGRPFFAMENIQGESLNEYVKTRKLSWQEIIGLAIQLAEGMGEAHRGGVIHRDIKPSNILVDSTGRAKILDFGLAVIKGEKKLTKTGSTLGTLQYMSPEQTRGELLDERSDIFSFGVVLYEMITGQTPFRGEHEPAIMYSIAYEEPEPLARYKSGVLEDCQRIVTKALTKRKDERYQHADELAADLKRLTPTIDVAQSSRKRRLRTVVPSLVMLGLIVTALVIKPWRFEISPTQESQAATNWLAVMYFDNIADPADSKRLGEIATNLLMTGLSQSEYIRVMSSQRLYDLLKQMGKEGVKTIDRATASQIAKKAEAKWMVTGTILQTEPKLVLTSQLIDVSTGGVVTSRRVVGEAGEDIFAVIDKLSAQLRQSDALPAGVNREAQVFVADVTTHSQEAFKYYLDGMEYFEKTYMEEAGAAFQKAIDLDSTFVSAYLWLSRVSGGEEQVKLLAKAQKFAEHATDRERMSIRYHYLGSVDSVDASIRMANEYLRLYPDDKIAYWELAQYYLSSPAQRDTATMLMEKSLQFYPNFKLAWNLLAYLYCAQNEFDKARTAIEKHVALAPEEANPYDSRGDLYAYSGQLDSAIESYRKALSIKPDFYYGTIEKLGRMYLLAGQFQRAESLYQAALNIPDSGMAYRSPILSYAKSRHRGWLVDIAEFQGQFNKALGLADDCISTNKLDGMDFANAILYLKKGEIFDYLRMWDSAAASARINESLRARLRPDDTLGYEVTFSRWHFRAGDTVKAAHFLERLSVASSSIGRQRALSYWHAMGEIALARAEVSRAIDYFRRAAAGSLSVNQPTFYRLAEAYLESGDARNAIRILEELLKNYFELSKPSSDPYMGVTANYLLGRAYEATGNVSKAQAAYEKFLTIWKDADPGLKDVEDAKARLARLKAKP